MNYYVYPNELYHFGVKGMKWGVRRYQNTDGSYKSGAEGRYSGGSGSRRSSGSSRFRLKGKKLTAAQKTKLKKIAKGVAIGAAVAGAGYLAYRNRGAIGAAAKKVAAGASEYGHRAKQAASRAYNQKVPYSARSVINEGARKARRASYLAKERASQVGSALSDKAHKAKIAAMKARAEAGTVAEKYGRKAKAAYITAREESKYRVGKAAHKAKIAAMKARAEAGTVADQYGRKVKAAADKYGGRAKAAAEKYGRKAKAAYVTAREEGKYRVGSAARAAKNAASRAYNQKVPYSARSVINEGARKARRASYLAKERASSLRESTRHALRNAKTSAKYTARQAGQRASDYAYRLESRMPYSVGSRLQEGRRRIRKASRYIRGRR